MLTQVFISHWRTAICCVLMFIWITIICLHGKLASKQVGKQKNKALQGAARGILLFCILGLHVWH